MGDKNNSSAAGAAPFEPAAEIPTASATPGPWRVVKARTMLHIVGDGHGVCGISISANHVHEDRPGDKRRYVERQVANAFLIAAAPATAAAASAMLAALKDAHDALDILMPGIGRVTSSAEQIKCVHDAYYHGEKAIAAAESSGIK